MAEFVRVAGRGDVPAGEMLIVEIEGEEIVLANVGGQIYAFGNGCTHRGGPLGEGLLEGDEVAHGHGDGREGGDHPLPVVDDGQEGAREQPQEQGEARRL